MPGSSPFQAQLAAHRAAEAAQLGDWCVWRLPHGSYNGVPLDTGEVFALAGAPNDAKLLRNRMAEPLGARERVACGECGRMFLTAEQTVGHTLRAHPANAATGPESREPRSASALVNAQAALTSHDRTTPAEPAEDAESSAPRAASSARGAA